MKKFIFFLLIVSLGGLVSNCNLLGRNARQGADKYASETRHEFGFREIKAGNAVILIISVQEEFAVAVEGEEEFLKDVKTEVNGETLVISTKGNKISPTNKVRLRISMPELLALELWGASEATVTKAKSDSLKLQIGGSSVLKIDGETKSLTAAANGVSKIDAENLKTENAEVRAAGTSEIIVSAANDLTADALGASTIIYAGDPKNLKPNIAGAGEVRKK
jgi:hypothetical protein